MEDVGFVRGIGTSVAFQHPERDLACAVHEDDFTFSGEDKDLDWAESLMKSWFEVVVRARLGPEEKDDKEISVLGRIVKVEDWGFLLPGGSATQEGHPGEFRAGRGIQGLHDDRAGGEGEHRG